jgi:Transmembrane family 220, helix
MKILNFLLAIMFLAFAYLQFNDPDPIIWISIYGVMAAFAVMAIFGIYPKKIHIAVLVIYALYSIYYFPGVMEWLHQEDKATIFNEMEKEKHLFIEESREFFGLLICVIVLLFYILRPRR